MPSSAAVLDELTDITVRVLGCEPSAVQPDATFADLGADSLTLVEIAEELGRRCDTYLRDDAVDQIRTVQDAVSAVTEAGDHGRGGAATAPLPREFATPSSTDSSSTESSTSAPPPAAPAAPRDTSRERRRARGAAGRMTAIGLAIGAAIGLLFAGVVQASGLSDVALPPLPGTSESASPTPTPTPTPTPEPEPSASPKPSLEIPKTEVAPGERFTLSGRFPELGADADLQIEVREGDEDWDDFPVTMKTRGEGEFETQIYTSRTGEREFRVTHEASGDSTPVVQVQIG